MSVLSPLTHPQVHNLKVLSLYSYWFGFVAFTDLLGFSGFVSFLGSVNWVSINLMICLMIGLCFQEVAVFCG